MATKRSDPNYAQITGHIPKDLSLQFRVACTANSLDLSEGLEAAIQQWLQGLGSASLPSLNPKIQPASLIELIENNRDKILQERVSEKRLTEILNGDTPCDLESARIALATGFSVEVVEELIAQHGNTKQRRETTNGA